MASDDVAPYCPNGVGADEEGCGGNQGRPEGKADPAGWSAGLGSGSSLNVALGAAESYPATLNSGDARKSESGLGSDNPRGDSSAVSKASAAEAAPDGLTFGEMAGKATTFSVRRARDDGSRFKEWLPDTGSKDIVSRLHAQSWLDISSSPRPLFFVSSMTGIVVPDFKDGKSDSKESVEWTAPKRGEACTESKSGESGKSVSRGEMNASEVERDASPGPDAISCKNEVSRCKSSSDIAPLFKVSWGPDVVVDGALMERLSPA